MPSFITYESFGAVGDGRTDDLPAIVKAHQEANRLHLPVKAQAGATYYLSPKGLTATVQTSVDWTGAHFLIDDVGCENITAPIFHVASAMEPLPLAVSSMVDGQTTLPNPHGCDLFVAVENANHRDYIRKGLNQDNGHTRTDVFVLDASGRLSSPLSFDFDEITSICAYPIDAERITLTGGNLEAFLGVRKFLPDRLPSADQVGLVTGLAWTSVGGETLEVEVNVMEGSGKLELTGNLGDVMKESAHAALSYIRANAHELGVKQIAPCNTMILDHTVFDLCNKDNGHIFLTFCTQFRLHTSIPSLGVILFVFYQRKLIFGKEIVNITA